MKRLKDYHNHIPSINERARMINSSKNKITIIVEGISDKRFFQQWLNNKNARIEYVEGKDYVYNVWEDSKKRKSNSIFCIVDLDYDNYLSIEKINSERFVYISFSKTANDKKVECNDLETALFMSNAFKKLCLNKFPEIYIRKISNLSNHINSLRNNLVNAAAFLGSYRVINLKQSIHNQQVYFEPFEVEEIFFKSQNNTIIFDQFKKYIESKICGPFQKEDLHYMAKQIYNGSNNPWELARGHDMSEMLSKHLTYIHEKFNPSPKKRYISRYEIERDLRMSFEGSMVKNTLFGQEIDHYQNVTGKTLFQFA